MTFIVKLGTQIQNNISLSWAPAFFKFYHSTSSASPTAKPVAPCRPSNMSFGNPQHHDHPLNFSFLGRVQQPITDSTTPWDNWCGQQPGPSCRNHCQPKIQKPKTQNLVEESECMRCTKMLMRMQCTSVEYWRWIRRWWVRVMEAD